MAYFIGKPNSGSERGWQMVPLGGQKEVTLQGGSGLNVVDGGAHKKIVKLTQTTPGGSSPATRKFTIKGLKTGKTAVWAKQGNKIAATLVVNVRPQRVVTIAFNYVECGEGKIPLRKTKRSSATAPVLLEKLNGIYVPQANVKFQQVAARPLRIKEDLGEKVIRNQKTPLKDGFSVLVAHRVPGAQVNVFFVWECQKAGRGHDTDGVAQIAVSRTEKTNCMVEDNLGNVFENVVAHEVGHNLGLKDNYSNPKLLMYGQSSKTPGTLLEKADIERIWA